MHENENFYCIKNFFLIFCPYKEKWAPEAKKFCPKCPLILVGCKKDLRNDQKILEKLSKRKQESVTPMQARTVANRTSAYAYIECSAKTREGVHAVFQTATKAALITKKSNHPNCALL